MIKRIFAVSAAVIMLCFATLTASAYDYNNISEGAYQIKTELSCYVNAMGGVEFGAPLLVSSQLKAAADGSKTMTLHFTKSSVTIYNITCDTFIDVSPSYVTETNGVKSGTIGYYDENGSLVTDGVTYTLSDDTAENAQKEQVHYVDSITFPITHESDTYKLTLFVNSNVMGTQFTADGYAATLTVDWNSLSAEEQSRKHDAKNDGDASSKTDTSKSQTTSGNGDVENKEGLNIYHTDEETGNESTEQVPAESDGTYIAHFKKPLLIAVGVAAVIMIAAGVVLVAVGRKGEKQ